MREIKFRAWCVENQEWLTEYEFSISQDGDRIFLDNGDVFDVPKEYIIVRFTGLKDKNGKEIYEDDLVKNNYYIWRIIFKDGAFYLDNQKDGGKWIILEEEKHCEIIGNVYENPELLIK